jgi:hypothetical protein
MSHILTIIPPALRVDKDDQRQKMRNLSGETHLEKPFFFVLATFTPYITGRAIE